MPNKTIYVSDNDLPLYERAQDLAGGNLSAAIVTALRRFVEVQEASIEGYQEITVQVGLGKGGRKLRFSGMLLGEWRHYTGDREERYRVYRTPKGKFALHLERSPEWTAGPNNTGGWRSYLGMGTQDWRFAQGQSTLEVVDSLEALRELIPPELYEIVVSMAEQLTVEELDI